MINVKDIIRDVPEQGLNKLELDDTFEIELNGETYYTLIDMEDGNYIALDNNRKVFRLHHDSYEPAREIYPSIEAFLHVYNGEKESMTHLFD